MESLQNEFPIWRGHGCICFILFKTLQEQRFVSVSIIPDFDVSHLDSVLCALERPYPGVIQSLDVLIVKEGVFFADAPEVAGIFFSKIVEDLIIVLVAYL